MGNAFDLTLMLKALGDPTRRRIYDFLRTCCCPVAVDAGGAVRPAGGPTVGDVCCQIIGGNGQGQSTISHHLKELRTAGLIVMERRGKHIICGIDDESRRALAAYFAGELAGIPAVAGECCDP
jgi:ArsR family transcriptional regulator, arsenate/arsenite/antimonite-responsive transcriptional repressor